MATDKKAQEKMVEDGLADLFEDDYDGPPPNSKDGSEGETAEAETPKGDDKAVEDEGAVSESQPADSGEAESEEKAGRDQPADAEEAKPVEGQGEQAEEKPAVQTFKYRNKEYTFDDLTKDPDLFTKVITGANQQSHYQELYEKQKAEAEEARRILEQRQLIEEQKRLQAEQEELARHRAAQAQQAQSVITPDAVKGHYGAQVDMMIKEGWLEEDVKEFYPATAAGIMYMRDTLLTEIATLKQQVAGLIGYAQSQQHTAQTTEYESQRQTVQQQINGIFDDISNEGGIFEPLKDKKIRSDFVTELQNTVNPEVKAILENPQILRNLWIAKNHETLMALANKEKVSPNVSPEDARRLVSGEGAANVQAQPKNRDAVLPGDKEGWGDMF